MFVKNCKVWFPGAFSPNGDGKNDIAKLVGNPLGITNYRLSIYNRWGQRVYYTEMITEGWDGMFGGKKVMDTYYYLIEYGFEGNKEMMKGDIILVQ